MKAQEPVVSQLFIYPKAGQSSEPQARDREDCHRWAVVQTGVDPRVAADASTATTGTTKTLDGITAAKRADYLRADGARLEGRNYSVE